MPKHDPDRTIGHVPAPTTAARSSRQDVLLPSVRPLSSPLVIDGNIDKPAWKNIAWTDDFVDIEGDLKPKPRLRTRIKMMWDDTNFYVAAQMEEPHVWGTLTMRDSVIFHDNDFEVFLNPSCDTRNYYELEVNALNTVVDLLLRKPYREGGQADNSYIIKGLQTAVKVHGTLNNPNDTDKGWDVEIAMPWGVQRAHDHAGTTEDGRCLEGELLAGGVGDEGRRWEVQEDRGEEGRQLGVVADGPDRHASAGSLGERHLQEVTRD